MSLNDMVSRVAAVDAPIAPPGVAVVGRHADGRTTRAAAGIDAAGEPIVVDSIFPLSSVTKLALGLAVLAFVDDGALRLDQPIRHVLRDIAADDDAVTIRRLLSHSAGLPLDLTESDVPYDATLDWPAVARACATVPLRYAPGTLVQYSNVGFGLLARAIEVIAGESIWPLVRRLVLDRLPVPLWLGYELPCRAAVIGDVRSRHVGTSLEPLNGARWRDLALPWGALFGTLDGLLALLGAYTAATPLVGESLRSEVASDQAGGLPGGWTVSDPILGFDSSGSIAWRHCPWGLCVEVRGGKAPHWTPPTASPESFGQIGSSGCVVWTDPARGAAWAIAGTRTTDSGWLLRYGPQLGTTALR